MLDLGVKVPRDSVAIWWLGQNGYIFKSAGGTLIGVDLYLTNSCVGLVPGVCLDRQVPILLPPEELALDVFACTHNHQDHTDPATIRAIPNKPGMRFVGPHPSCEVFRREGVPEDRIVAAWPDCDLRFGDVRLHGTFALPTDDTDLNHMGYLVEFDGGPRVWISGDTAFSPLVASAARYQPDIAIICINGGFNNLSHWQAAEVVAQVNPKLAIPCHYDMFADNSVDPHQFEVALKLRAPQVRYQQLEHGRPFVYSPQPARQVGC